MRKITLALKFLIFVLAVSNVSTIYAQSVASYTITFTSVWDTESNDPINGNSTMSLPGNAHWSDLVGATHNSDVVLLEMGSLASLGVKNVAEFGSNTALMNEVQGYINDGDADQFLQAGFQDFAPRTSAVLMNIEVSADYPMLSLLSMIAPSPDWIIAVNSINLRENGSWVNEIVLDLFPYDAGTDSGTNYTSGNQVTNPAQPITSLVNVSPFNDKPMGTLTISFNETLSIAENDLNEVNVFPNPSNGFININSRNENPLQQASVYDILGKEVARIENVNNQTALNWNLESLNSGMYLVRLTLSDGRQSTKRIIMN